ncbi:hypothetical protein Amet_1774 [Alkaliphilus metalliredigens QYMF]|uniref:Uncharacterized protein n=1 Tax=Alkaliphilus metalliredigens (strain QYMF) TaxID=293826 RepID=A6TP28_ALKMQ|nr:hypothetical protein [Alkaliphilus metalliredigens]ABR47946.1 hypothetical protein Amet_1774 [Alkaliphilus metalliredigens QYMF]
MILDQQGKAFSSLAFLILQKIEGIENGLPTLKIDHKQGKSVERVEMLGKTRP